MTEANQSLVLEILKQIQGDMATMKADIHELKQGQVRIREDVHANSGHVISLEKTIMDLDQRVQRIEKRLDLVEA